MTEVHVIGLCVVRWFCCQHSGSYFTLYL